MQDNMSMTIYWSQQCSFIFESWTTQNVFPFIIACLICAVFAAMSLLLAPLRQKLQRIAFTKVQTNILVEQQTHRSAKEDLRKQSIITNRNSSQPLQIKKDTKYSIFLFIYYLIFSTQHVTLMLLIMTMNGYVIISILLGLTIGYYISLQYVTTNQKNSDSSSPVNCCAND